MSEWLALILFGMLQGFTEFLPVSSSGHLILFQYFSKSIEESLTLNIAVHLGTFFTVLIYYRSEILKLIKGVLCKDQESLQIFLWLVIASIPTALIGLFMKKKMEFVLTSPLVSAFCLLLTGALLIWSTRLKLNFNKENAFGLNLQKALILGVVQGIAVLPGISRSGSTIVTGLALGMAPAHAAQFSFLVSLPAMLGATILEFSSAEETIAWAPLGLGAFVSFFTGLLAISWMVKLTQKAKFQGFAYYVVGVSLFFLFLYSNRWGENLF